MKTFIYLSKLISSIASLAKVAPNLALDVIVALFFGYGLHELLSVARQSKEIFEIFGVITVTLLIIFTIIVLITHRKEKL